MAFPWFPENQYSEKGFFGEGMKTFLESKLLMRVSFFFNFLTTRRVSNREIKENLKTSPTAGKFFGTRQNFNRDFYSVSENDTTILSPVSFWMENFSFQTLKQNSFHQENLLENEQSLNQNFRDKIRFWNKLPQRSRIRINNFKMCQVLKLKSSEARKIEGKTFPWNQCLRENLLLKKHFLHNFSMYESQVLRWRALLKTMEECEKNLDNKFEKKIQKLVWFRISFFTKAPILKRETENVCVFQPIFYNSSNFESIFLQRVRFWLSFFTDRHYFESKNIKRIRLRSEIVFQKNKVRWKTQFQKNSFLIFSHGNNAKIDYFLLTWTVWFCEWL